MSAQPSKRPVYTFTSAPSPASRPTFSFSSKPADPSPAAPTAPAAPAAPAAAPVEAPTPALSVTTTSVSPGSAEDLETPVSVVSTSGGGQGAARFRPAPATLPGAPGPVSLSTTATSTSGAGAPKANAPAPAAASASPAASVASAASASSAAPAAPAAPVPRPRVVKAQEPPADLLAAASSEDRKKNLNVVFIGHVDAGKSTTAGHLLFELGNLDQRLLQKFEEQARALNRESWKYAFAMDTSEEEREKGKTVECARAAFVTPQNRKITILDAPGHKGFVHNMIGGTAQADVAVLIVSARKGEFECGFERGGQTSEHALISFVCGIKQIVVCVNKIDDPTVGYDESRYTQIRDSMLKYLTEVVGYQKKNIFFLPISGFTGENLTKPSTNAALSWYKGPTFLQLMDEIKVPKRDTKGALRAVISGRYREAGTCVIAKVEQGRCWAGMTVTTMPGETDCEIVSIEDEEGTELPLARSGDNIRIKVRDEEEDSKHLAVGSVLCSPENLCAVTNSFNVRLILVDHPNVLTNGFECVLHLNMAQVKCTVQRILATLDTKTGKVAEQLPKFARPGQHCICTLKTSQPVCVSVFSEMEALGRVLLRYESFTIGIGVVIKLK